MPKKKTHEQFAKEVLELGKGDYELLTRYELDAKKVQFSHKKCGNIFEMKPNAFKQGARCPKCAIKTNANKQRKTHEQFEKEVKELVGTEFTVLGKYIGNKSKILFRHNVCGYEFERIAVKFITENHKCPKCSHRIENRTTESLKKEIELLTNKEYELLSEYANMRTKIKIKHNKCGHEWLIAPDTFINQGVRCPRCSTSKTEIIIKEYLQVNNFEFKTQYKIKECKNKRPLPFDFAIFDQGKLLTLVEYDGEQHYKPWYKLGKELAEKQLEKTQYNDAIKNDYCKNHNIKLIRIPYWHNYKVTEYLEEQLSDKFNTIQLALL